MGVLIAEELLLLVTSPEGKWLARSDAVPLALAGGVLAELAMLGKVGVDDRDRIRLLDTTPAGDQVLDEAVAVFAEMEGRRPKHALGKVAKGLGDRLYDRLVAAGIVEIHKVPILPIRHFPLRDPNARRRIWDEVAAVLRGQRQPDARTGTLIGLAVAAGCVVSVFEPDTVGVPHKQLQRRAQQVADGEWATDAVGRAVHDAQAATIAAVTAALAATTAATIGSG